MNENYKETKLKNIEDIFNREYTYVDSVFDKIVGIMCNVHGISEKDFKSYTNIKKYVEDYFDNNQEILLEIDRFNQSKKRAEYCAEFLFDINFNGIVLADNTINIGKIMTFGAFLESKKEIIKGGAGCNMSLKDIAKKHNVPTTEIEKQFEIGKLVEIEHTIDKTNNTEGNKKINKEIAFDHLAENPRYYTDLVEAGLIDEIGALMKYVELFDYNNNLDKEVKNKYIRKFHLIGD